MKMRTLFFLVVLGISAQAFGDDLDRGGRPDRGRPDRRGRCLVNFDFCQLRILGQCVKWQNRTEEVPRWEARDACYYFDQEYNGIRRCRVSCPR